MSSGVKQKLSQSWTTVVMLYTSGQRTGWRHNLLHFFTCLFISLALSSLLFLSLRALNFDLMVTGLTVAGFSLLLSVALFVSKRLRCFILLLLISCATKQGQTALLITGSGLVACLGTQNTYRNLYRASQSIVCNLKKKKELLDTSPINNYIQMIKWVRDQLKMFSDLGVVKFEADLKVWFELDSKNVQEKLELAETELQKRAGEVEDVFNAVMAAGRSVAPLLTILQLVVFTALFLKKYTSQNRYKNKFFSSRFVEYDQQQKAMGKPHVLPLTKKESRRYIFIPSAKLTLAECGPMALALVPVGVYVLIWFLLLGLDWLLYRTIALIEEKLKGVEPFRVPLKMNVNERHQVLFVPVAESSSQMDFSFSVSLYERECRPELTLLLSQAVAPLCTIIAVLLTLSLLTSKMQQVKLLVSEYFFTERGTERLKHLHSKILSRRSKENSAQLEQNRFQSLRKDVKFWLPILDFCSRTSLRQQR